MEMKACPFCMGDVPTQARKCRYCGEWLTENYVNVGYVIGTFAAKHAARSSQVGKVLFMVSTLLGVGCWVAGASLLLVVFCWGMALAGWLFHALGKALTL